MHVIQNSEPGGGGGLKFEKLQVSFKIQGSFQRNLGGLRNLGSALVNKAFEQFALY